MRSPAPAPLPVGSSPIQSVLLVPRFGPHPRGFPFTATSSPGHLLHLVISGCVRQQCNGRSYDLRPGTLIWYHEDEWVTGSVLQGAWEFYSVNFIAPGLPPPGFESRLFPDASPELRKRFSELLEIWDDHTLPASIRQYRVHSTLLDILSRIPRLTGGTVHMDVGYARVHEFSRAYRQHFGGPPTCDRVRLKAS